MASDAPGGRGHPPLAEAGRDAPEVIVPLVRIDVVEGREPAELRRRTDDRVLVQVFQQGRSEEQKKALYARLAERPEADCAVAPTDLAVSVAANGREDWSFGLGRAQFLEGDL